MTSFGALFHRRREPLAPDDVARLRRALDSERGVDVPGGSNQASGTPASTAFVLLTSRRSGSDGEARPASLGATPRVLAKQLGFELESESEPRSAILARAYRRVGHSLWLRVEGPFGQVVFEPVEHRLVLVCDALGRRPLYFFETEDLVVVASEIETLLRWPAKNWCLDAEQLTRFFALEVPGPGKTCFREIRQVEMGSAVVFGPEGSETHRFWRPLAIRRSKLRSDSDFAAAFLERLGRAVRRSLGDPAKLGIMLSGGLDSTSLAVLAARAAREQSACVGAASWVFDDLSQCDERSWMAETLAGEDFEVIRIAGDRLWPLCEPDLFSSLPGSPEENPYRALKRALYRTCALRGRDRLWNGGPADFLQRGGNLYLRDLLLAGRWRTAASCAVRQLRDDGAMSALAALARVAWPAGRGRNKVVPPWLTRQAASRLEATPVHSEYPPAAARDVTLFLRMQARSQVLEAQLARTCGVDVSSPYWTRGFVELLLSLPTHAVFRPGTTKFVAREAMRGIVPESIRLRQAPTPLDPLFERGLFERQTDLVQDLLFDGEPIWDRFVDRSFVSAIGLESPSAHKLMLWRCASFEHWRRRHGWEVG